MNERKRSFALAKQYRTCPPPGLLNVEAHLSGCPYCAAKREKEILAWEALLTGIGNSKLEIKRKNVGKGLICLVDPRLSGWKQEKYFNPPHVIVMETGRPFVDAARVVQIYHDVLMAGPGDLVFEARGWETEVFAETWHYYTMRISDLIPTGIKVEKRILEAVKTMMDDPSALPEWAPLTTVIRDNDPREFFRRMEVETGHFFSSPSMADFMNRIENIPGFEEPDEVESARAEILEICPGVTWSGPCRDFLSLLASATHPPETLPMAASEDEDMPVTGSRIVFREKRVAEFSPVIIEVMEREIKGNRLHIAGRIRDFTADLRKAGVEFLAVDDDVPIKAVFFEIDPLNGFYVAAFETTNKEIRIRINFIIGE